MGPLEVGWKEETGKGNKVGRSAAAGGGGARACFLDRGVDAKEQGRECRGAANKEGGEELLGILKSLWTLSINIKGKNNIQQANFCFESTYGETIATAGKACRQL